MSAAEGPLEAVEPVPLKRGRHGLSREEVETSQRRRIGAAMLELVAARGYRATTVPDVIAAARVSRNAFYRLYDNKDECFLAVCDAESAELLALTLGDGAGDDWRAAVAAGTERYLAWWAARPDFARAYFVELPAAGAPALAQRDRAYEQFAGMFTTLAALAREQEPSLPPLGPIVPRVLVYSITELVAAELRAGHADRLGDLAPEITALVVRLIGD